MIEGPHMVDIDELTTTVLYVGLASTVQSLHLVMHTEMDLREAKTAFISFLV